MALANLVDGNNRLAVIQRAAVAGHNDIGMFHLAGMHQRDPRFIERGSDLESRTVNRRTNGGGNILGSKAGIRCDSNEIRAGVQCCAIPGVEFESLDDPRVIGYVERLAVTQLITADSDQQVATHGLGRGKLRTGICHNSLQINSKWRGTSGFIGADPQTEDSRSNHVAIAVGQLVDIGGKRQDCPIQLSVIADRGGLEDHVVGRVDRGGSVNELVKVGIGRRINVQVVLIEVDVDRVKLLGDSTGGANVAHQRLWHNSTHQGTQLQLEDEREIFALLELAAVQVLQPDRAAAVNHHLVGVIHQRFAEAEDDLPGAVDQAHKARFDHDIVAASQHDRGVGDLLGSDVSQRISRGQRGADEAGCLVGIVDRVEHALGGG